MIGSFLPFFSENAHYSNVPWFYLNSRMQIKVTAPCCSADIRVKNTGLMRRLLHHIHHVEDKSRRRCPPVSQLIGKLPPPWPPLAFKSEVPSWNQIVASFLSEHDPSEIV